MNQQNGLECEPAGDDAGYDEGYDDAVQLDVDQPDAAQDPLEVEVRRNAGLAALVGAAASALAIAYVARAIAHGGAFDWVLAVVLGAIGVSQLVSLVDARTPLLVADSFGIRLRLGREWRGLPWSSLEQVVVEPRTSMIHDGRLVVAPRHLNRALEGLDAKARRQVAVAQRVYGAPLVVPLGLTTRVSSKSLVDDLTELADDRAAVVELSGYVAEPAQPDDLTELADDRAAVVELSGYVAEPAQPAQPAEPAEPEPPAPTARPDEVRLSEPETAEGESAETPEARDPRGTRVLNGLATMVSRFAHGRSHDVDVEPNPTNSPTPAPASSPASSPANSPIEPAYAPAAALREARPAARADVHLDTPVHFGAAAPKLAPRTADAETAAGLPEGAQLRRGDDAGWGSAPDPGHRTSRVFPISRPGSAVEPLVIDDYAPESAITPVIGPRIAAARTRLGFGIDTLSTRTRIRPHLLEAIEVDDFAPCGGDFYSRGHLRALARVLGLPPEELVEEFDKLYASAPINARKVFEAELATGMSGGIRATFGGPRWGLMTAVVLCLVLAWGMARLFTDTPNEVTDPSPVLNGSAGLASNQKPITSALGQPVLMTVKAVRGPADVLVRDHSGRVLFAGHLLAGGHSQLFGVGPFTVRASVPASVDVWVAGKAKGAVGEGDQVARRTFG